MDEIIRVLIDRLIRRGIEPGTIPAYIRDVANTMASHSELSLPELNRRMQLLGWGDCEVDDHTLQLITAVFQSHPSSIRKTEGNYESEIQSRS